MTPSVPGKSIGNVWYVYRSNFFKQQPPPSLPKNIYIICYETHTDTATKASTQILNTRLDTIIHFKTTCTCISINKDNIGIGSAYDTISFLRMVLQNGVIIR